MRTFNAQHEEIGQARGKEMGCPCFIVFFHVKVSQPPVCRDTTP